MDKLTRERLRARRKIFVRFLIFILLFSLLVWGLRPEFFFKKPQYIFDNSWWLDFAGHFFIFFVIGFLAIYESRLILQSGFRRLRAMLMECLGWGALFVIGEFIFDLFRPHYFPWLDSAQKGNTDTMYDLVADGSGVLAAIFLWLAIKAVYAWLYPSDARAEYLAERAELAAHQKAEARKIEREHIRELRKELASLGRKLIEKPPKK